jgi:coenzyme F420-0:L-glutamate ligase/coenzyme F420-1:gamma-L-glutamate ligase
VYAQRRADVQLIPIVSQRLGRPFNLYRQLGRMLQRARQTLEDGDILAVSGKFIAMAQGRYLELDKVRPMRDAVRIGKRHSISPALAEVILRESDYLLKGLEGFVLTVKDGAFAPNAGVDKSNIMKGYVILHPSQPDEAAHRIADWALLEFGSRVGVVVTDSRLQPLRMGTVGTAIGSWGIPSLMDDRGREDLFGNIMKVTRRAVADDLASAAQLLMGETAEGVPAVLIRGSGIEVRRTVGGMHVSIPPSQCIFVKGLSSTRLLSS